MSASLTACETRSHWALDLVDMLASFTVVKDKLWQSGVSFVTLNWEACAVRVELVYSKLKHLDLSTTIFKIRTDFTESFINIFLHREAFSELSSDSMLSIVKNAFRWGSTNSIWMTSWFDQVVAGDRGVINQWAEISSVIILSNEVLPQVVVVGILVNASESESLASSGRVRVSFEEDIDNTNGSSLNVPGNG